ncbi:MAG: hypothetical protein ACRD22_12500 [Terriglobia bacterium]
MKKYVVAAIVLIALAGLAKLAGLYVGARSALSAVEVEAHQHHMPTGFFGVSWLDSTDALLAARPSVVPVSDSMVGESVQYLGRPAQINYYVKGGNVLMFAIHFAGVASEAVFQAANQSLDQEYGPMSSPKHENDDFGPKYCSHRQSGRFNIDHCMRLQEQVLHESVVFYRSKPR